MAEKFSRYDSADYLNSLEDIAYYLEAALEEAGDDPAFITHALGLIARSQNLSELARKVGMSREGLSNSLSNEGNPSFATIYKVTLALGLQLEFHAVPCRIRLRRPTPSHPTVLPGVHRLQLGTASAGERV